MFTHETRNMSFLLAVHGDDFLAVGSPADLRWYEAGLLKLSEGKVKGTMASPRDELRILNRVVVGLETGTSGRLTNDTPRF